MVVPQKAQNSVKSPFGTFDRGVSICARREALNPAHLSPTLPQPARELGVLKQHGVGDARGRF